MEWVGSWEWKVEAAVPGSRSRFAWTGTAFSDSVLARLGFNVSNIHVSKPNQLERKHAVLVPWWAVFGVTCVVAVKWLFFRERRLYWGKVGRCAACGYDLRESRGRCPECGQSISSTLINIHGEADRPAAIVPARENRENIQP